MKIVEVLTYYRPWVSGLTIYVERLSKALARQGHEVTVLTSQYDPNLPIYDVIDGVKVVRIPVAARVSKGVLMPGFGPMAWKLAQQADVLHLHLPQFDAPGVAMRGRILNKPVVLTYHCDLQLPHGAFNRLVDRVVLSMNQLAGKLADAVVTYTRDYGTHSPFLSQFLDEKLHIIPPPVELPKYSQADVQAFRNKHNLGNEPIVGIICRLAAEKGVEVLLKALPIVREKFPNVRVLHAGQYQNIIGEEAYAARLAPLFEQYKDHYHLLGNIEGAELSAFYNCLDCLCVPSLNSTESFGLVQIEAMQKGVPVAACALPGVRQPVTMTGMGEVTAVSDHNALAQAIINILQDKQAYQRDSQLIGNTFLPDATAEAYLALFQKLQQGKLVGQTAEPAAYDKLRAMRDAYEK
ncbi:MAG: glycosyltransferase family 4 protein [Anaerolineales bacterium]|nr:glycosyltransferase family 4 protein [Anaerolineales bacterium]MCB8936772.1 glycosyltransferase family 4 protein [Ardenticatenaceae bacterium]